MQFKKESFWSLLSNNEIKNITIPIIQRAYTQGGRKGDKKIEEKGERFVKRLVEALTDKNKPITLDFIYGSNVKNKVYPLDGQQRLTTLFLLYWYIAQKEDKLSDAVTNLKKFTYETRQSSRYFCEHLCEYKVNNRSDKLSDTVKNQKWFMLSWENDPSICSMLEMLDKIDTLLKDETDVFWHILTTASEKECPIFFLYTSLEDLNLTDDLYVKMNARGLELTDFEKFKAPFNRKIDEECWDKDKECTETFAHKIDTDWTDLFWKYKDEAVNAEYKIDNKLTNFIAGTAINCYAQHLDIATNKEEENKIRKELSDNGKTKNVTDDAVKKERIEKRITCLFNNPDEVNPDDFPTKNAFDYLVKCLNIYSKNNYAELKPDVDLWKYCSDTLFKDIIQNEKIGWQNRAVFYAQTIYLLAGKYSDTTFNDWMRVVRNIVENSTIDSAQTFIAAVNLIQELSVGCSGIYKYLSKNTINTIISGHAQEQVKEEIEKAKIIDVNPDTKQAIHATEDTNFCKGKIDFAMYCIDYNIHDIKVPYPATFDENRLDKIRKVITDHLSDDDVTNDFRRAFLTIRNNNFYTYWISWLYAGGVESPKYRMLENTKDLKKYFALRGNSNCNIYNNNWDYLKELLNNLTTKTIDEIITAYMETPQYNWLPNWKKRIISTKNSINKSEKHYIAVSRDDSCCWLIPGKRVSNDANGKRSLKKIQ
jgi:hypothetical protein